MEKWLQIPLQLSLLVGLGLHEFSVNASMVLKVKKLISMIDSKEAEEIANKVLTLKTAKEVEAYLDSKLRKYMVNIIKRRR